MHLFRKYFNNRGSALFMVISTMTAVMISCMAMYFSVISSRSTQYVVFNQQQSKQSAISISDALLAGLTDSSQPALNALLPKMVALDWKDPTKNKLTTGANGFAAFAGSGNEDDPNLGSYMVEITRISETTFDIVVTSSVNGVKDVYHTVIDLETDGGGDTPVAPTQLFAATGYVPNDIFVEGGRYFATLFFDNELTYIDAYGNTDAYISGDLYTGGSLTNHDGIQPATDRAVMYAIRNTYTNNFNSAINFASGFGRSTVLIGGDCINNRQGGFTNANTYVLGDFYQFGNNLGTTNANYFVNGNVYLNKDVSGTANSIYTNGKIYLIDGSSSYGNVKIVGEVSSKGKWDSEVTKSGFLDMGKMIATLDEKTQTTQYYKWIIDEPYLNESLSSCNKQTIRFNRRYDAPIATVELKYSDSEKGCLIEDIICDGDGSVGWQDCALVIDTGEDESNVYTIRVKGNYDLDNDKLNVKETFSWKPRDNTGTEWGPNKGVRMNVIVKGRGSVVVDVPEGVIYQDFDNVRFMHYGWWLIGGGKVKTETYTDSTGATKSYTIYDTNSFKGGDQETTYAAFIHRECKAGDGCTYTEKKTDEFCAKHTDVKTTTISCGIHGALGTYCEKCFPGKVSTSENTINHTGECVDHVDRKKIDAEMASNPTLKSQLTGKDGKPIYPTTNIFLVSCEESAEFRFSQLRTGVGVKGNSFFGYVYAPYMTFKATGDNSGGGFVRMMGGMTVSDFIMNDSYTTIACWPEKMPTDLMSSESLKNQMSGLASKSWKINLTGH